ASWASTRGAGGMGGPGGRRVAIVAGASIARRRAGFVPRTKRVKSGCYWSGGGDCDRDPRSRSGPTCCVFPSRKRPSRRGCYSSVSRPRRRSLRGGGDAAQTTEGENDMSRKMIAALQVSLDGFTQGPDRGEADWVDSWADAIELIPEVDTFVQGAGMY